ncbi:MAG TPA: GvpL/GvpF family gas vesicle protein [Nitrolancea sp.]|jgi:hypothetical protein|nr:GvpL/GvpF family gas vesicle protein [Nitrolancea sp.]
MSSEVPVTSTATYVYCVGYARALAERSRDFSATGVGGPDGSVRVIVFDDLAAVVSDAPASRLDITRTNLMAHEQVIAEALERSSVLPVAFGTVALSDDEVREKLLEREYDELRRQLDSVYGCVELDLRVLWKREQLFERIAAEFEQIRLLRDDLVGLDPDSAYYQRIQLGELTAAAINELRESDSAAILSDLEPLAVEMKLNPNLTDMMIVNAAFLLANEQLPEFDAAVQALGASAADQWQFQYVGPLAPYNFVNVSIDWEE